MRLRNTLNIGAINHKYHPWGTKKEKKIIVRFELKEGNSSSQSMVYPSVNNTFCQLSYSNIHVSQQSPRNLTKEL